MLFFRGFKGVDRRVVADNYNNIYSRLPKFNKGFRKIIFALFSTQNLRNGFLFQTFAAAAIIVIV